MKPERLEILLKEFATKRILVIGDLMLDEFVWGRVSRISPEAPVPVVEVVRESYYPGGAANVARNVREFTPSVSVTGLVGEDSHAAKLRQLLLDNGIGLDGLQSDPNFQTIVKTRIIARQQQVVRVDRERPRPLSDSGRAETVRKIHESLPDIDAIIFEDYGKGLLQQDLVDEVTAMARAQGKLVTADPNPHNRLIWRGMTAVKPNRSEAFSAANQNWREPASNPLRDEALLSVGRELLRTWKPELLLITLGEQGMILFDQNNPPFHVPSRAREVYDLSGAGDTAISLFTLALASGASPTESAEISNHASSVVVGKLGTATLTPRELMESLRQSNS